MCKVSGQARFLIDSKKDLFLLVVHLFYFILVEITASKRKHSNTDTLQYLLNLYLLHLMWIVCALGFSSFSVVHFTSSRLTTHDLEQILVTHTHTTLNTWPLTQWAVPHTTSRRLLEGDINSGRQEKDTERQKWRRESRVHFSSLCL